jgi:hypothetical protein
MPVFLYPGFASTNSLDDLPYGQYHGFCSVYLDRQSGAKALVSEYWLPTETSARVVELQMINPDGQTVRFLDFVRMPDRSWRDSHGLRADSLGRLIPAHLASYSLFEQVETGIQNLEKHNV